ncbi:MAG: hypothetical protein HY007_00675 [Candidatus Sungbacteria bacterium]|nr:hypothetical protein [Candidatus Sungbacteria bacterium]
MSCLTSSSPIACIINKITSQILYPVIVLLFTLATIMFLWGVIQYVIGSQGDTGKLEKAKNVILYGIIGMFIMASAWPIVAILQNFFQ